MTTIPWSNLSPLDLLGRIHAIHPTQLGTVIDWGCGLNHSPISEQVRKMPCRTLYSVDAYANYLADPVAPAPSQALKIPFLAGERILAIARVEDYAKDRLKEEEGQADLSLCLDIIEHLDRRIADQFIEDLKEISQSILVWIPLGYAPISFDTYGGDNHGLHTHRSTWTEEDLTSKGFCVEVLEGFHTPIFGHRVDAGWAVWTRSDPTHKRGNSYSI